MNRGVGWQAQNQPLGCPRPSFSWAGAFDSCVMTKFRGKTGGTLALTNLLDREVLAVMGVECFLCLFVCRVH